MESRLSPIKNLFAKLKKIVAKMAEPMSVKIAHEYNYDPYHILVSCLLSLRARDSVTYGVSKELFKHISNPSQMVKMPLKDLERIIFSSGFYHVKAKILKAVSAEIIARFHGKVPSKKEELLSLPGVGLKTANLVLSEAFGIPALCVDTHVHRLANYLGLVSTKTPDQTERELTKIIPRSMWIEAHRLLIMAGQNRCDLSSLVLTQKERESIRC